MKARYYLLIPTILFMHLAMAQVRFINRNDLLGERDLHSAVPVAVADMNGDGLEDIVAMNTGNTLYVQYQTPDPARPFVRYVVPIEIDDAEQNDICIADLNNDGTNDMIIVGSYDRVKILYGIPNTYDFNLTYLEVEPFFSQGASSGDFNGDGWVDIVILNDNGANYTLLNDGTGTLVDTSFFNFITVPPSDNSGNYGSVYTDFDMDGDLDFYIAKCRQGVNNPNDPRRINVLFVNDGQNNYTQNAAAYGLASGHQTWTADFGDIDNDGDLDCFMTQHDVICQLYENIDNDTFVDITTQSGLNIGGVALQGMIRDFDNDGWQDILVSGDRVDFWQNNRNGSFTKQEAFGATIFGTFALGDLNHDGFTDVYASTVIPFNNPDLLREDILFLGRSNDNHFLSLQLIDSAGNPSAIGALATLYSDLGTQIREVRGGEQYGVSHSHGMIFGLGDETSYDSLTIRWPDGTIESFNKLSIDETWTIRRGGCTTTSANLLPGITALCDNDSLVLSLEGINVTSWSNGSDEDTLIIKEKGLYFATYLDENDCPVKTLPLEVIQNPDSLKPTITYEGNFQLCNGEVAVLSLPFAVGYQWSSGQNSQTIEANETGDYFASVQGYCLNQQSDTVSLNFLTPAGPVVTGDSFKLGEQAFLYATGDSIVWYDDPNGLNVVGTGSTLVLDSLNETTTYYAQNVKPIKGQDFQLGPTQQQGNTKYNGATVNGGLLFEVLEPIVFKELTVFTDSAGVRIIEISGSNFFFDQQVDLEPGTTVIPLNVELPVGEYTISTNTDLNNLVFGANNPYLWRSSSGVLYPYEINGVISINNSTFGSGFYYYFYDWKIATSDNYCTSELVPVEAVLEIEVATENVLDDIAVTVTPNPTSGTCQVINRSSLPVGIEVISIGGVHQQNSKKVLSAGENAVIDLSDYPSGVYFLRMVRDGQLVIRKIIKL